MTQARTWAATVLGRILPPRVLPTETTDFEQYARLVTLRHGVLTCVGFGVAALLFWPSDWLVFEGQPAVRATFAYWRLLLIAHAIAAAVLAPRLGRRPASILPTVAVFAVVLAVSAGYALATAGGPDLAWFHTLYIVPLVASPLSLSLRPRIAMTIGVTAAAMLGYFGSRPEYLSFEGMPTVFVALGGMGAVAVILGNSHYRLLRLAFEQSTQLGRRADALEIAVADRTQRLRRLTDHLERTREHERERIGRDLHDELAQLLTAIRLELQLAARDGALDLEPQKRLLKIVDELVSAKERIIAALQPVDLETLGLEGAVRATIDELRRRTGLTIDATIDLSGTEPGPDIAAALMRLLQEGLTNAVRHAAAACIDVTLSYRDQRVHVAVVDDGVGFDPEARSDGRFGLLGARERVEALRGELRIDSAPGQGARLAFWLPSAAPQA